MVSVARAVCAGLPLTFLDHRLLHGDSLAGPFFEKLLTLPSKDGSALEDLYSLGLKGRLAETLGRALVHVRDLEASIGKDEADIELKRAAKFNDKRSFSKSCGHIESGSYWLEVSRVIFCASRCSSSMRGLSWPIPSLIYPSLPT